MGTGPAASGTFDIALTELLSTDGPHRFLARAGTDGGADVLADLAAPEVEPDDLERRRAVLACSEAAITRRLETDDLPGLLARNLDHANRPPATT